MAPARHCTCGAARQRAYWHAEDHSLHLAIRPVHIVVLVCIMAAWSFNFIVMKWGVQDIPPLLFVALRFAVVALLLVPFAPLPRGRWRQLLLLSTTLGTVHFACMFTGIVLTPASTTVLIQQLQVPAASLLAALFLGDRLGWRRFAGLMLTLAGTVVVLGEPDLTSPWWSQGLVLAAALCWAVATIQIKLLHGVPPVTLNGWMALFAVPQLLLLSFLLEDGQAAALAAFSWGSVLVILYNSVVVVVVGYGTWYWMLKRYDVNQAMPFTLLMPLFGVLFAALFLDEPMGWGLLAGGIVTLIGVGLTVVNQRRATAEAEAETERA
jgi:O-acetylserine/cysteine efflux transporter